MWELWYDMHLAKTEPTAFERGLGECSITLKSKCFPLGISIVEFKTVHLAVDPINV